MLGRQATFARAARPPRSARRSVQFSAVARRRRMFPRQPSASAPASCMREPITVFKALADRHRVKILTACSRRTAKPSASATWRRCSTSSSRRSATTSSSCSTPASSRASSAARSPTSRSIPPPSSGSATSSRCLFARSPPDAASRGGRSSEPAELQGLRLCQRDSGPRLKIVVSPVKAGVSPARAPTRLAGARAPDAVRGRRRSSVGITHATAGLRGAAPTPPRRLPLTVQLSSSRASMAAPPHCRVRCELRYPALSPVASAVR